MYILDERHVRLVHELGETAAVRKDAAGDVVDKECTEAVGREQPAQCFQEGPTHRAQKRRGRSHHFLGAESEQRMFSRELESRNKVEVPVPVDHTSDFHFDTPTNTKLKLDKICAARDIYF